MTSITKDNWKPRHGPGGTYCSPACGAGCTKRAHEDAVANAQALRRQMEAHTGGAPWTVRVWENMGWFYSVQRGTCEIHATHYLAGPTSYWANILSALQCHATAAAPEEALQLALTQLRAAHQRVTEDLRLLEVL